MLFRMNKQVNGKWFHQEHLIVVWSLASRNLNGLSLNMLQEWLKKDTFIENINIRIYVLYFCESQKTSPSCQRQFRNHTLLWQRLYYIAWVVLPGNDMEKNWVIWFLSRDDGKNCFLFLFSLLFQKPFLSFFSKLNCQVSSFFFFPLWKLLVDFLSPLGVLTTHSNWMILPYFTFCLPWDTFIHKKLLKEDSAALCKLYITLH